MKVGTKLNLELLAGPDNVVQVLARVVWLEELPKGSPAKFDVGLAFLDVPEEMASRLAAILQKDEDYKSELEKAQIPDPVWADDDEDEDDERSSDAPADRR